MQQNKSTFKFKEMTFKDQLKQRAIINSKIDKYSNAFEQLEKMKKDGALDDFQNYLKQCYNKNIQSKAKLLADLLANAMLANICKSENQYVLQLSKGDVYRTVFGMITIGENVPEKVLETEKVYDAAMQQEPVPHKRLDEYKSYFVIEQADNADSFFPRNVIREYINNQGNVVISSNISTWTKDTIETALQQLDESEDILGTYDGERIIFEGIE